MIKIATVIAQIQLGGTLAWRLVIELHGGEAKERVWREQMVKPKNGCGESGRQGWREARRVQAVMPKKGCGESR